MFLEKMTVFWSWPIKFHPNGLIIMGLAYLQYFLIEISFVLMKNCHIIH